MGMSVLCGRHGVPAAQLVELDLVTESGNVPIRVVLVKEKGKLVPVTQARPVQVCKKVK